ncbi:MAG: response regulator [Gammaproteobacteria bacterium]|nr:response regulator [Gammaproteobacteria bacterium]
MNSNHAASTLPTVYIVERDTSVRRALTRLMQSEGYGNESFSSVDAFLESSFSHDNACIVADVDVPGISALELPERLRQIGANLPIVFLATDYRDETRERIRRAGGSGYFGKPVDGNALLDMIRWTTNGKYSV